jgi:SulP family sulfate permease
VRDLTAGVIVGIVAIPLAIAFAIASGVSPERGLWTAIIAGLIISAFGGSRVQIGGPTGAFVVIVYGIVQTHGVDGLAIATLMAGCILVVMGVARLGSLIKFIPHPVITGFTSGIAVIIFSSQIRDLFGLQLTDVPAEFLAKWIAFAEHAGSITPAAVLVGAITLAVIGFWPKISTRIPSPIVALVAATAMAQLLHLPVETIGSRFGELSVSMPPIRLPQLSLGALPALAGPAFAIAALAAIESLLSAVVADGMIGGRHRPNMELVAQGIANIASPLFGGIPATGAIARTATNIKNGGRTPIAGIAHALTVLLITLFFGRFAALIPMATLAAILVVVAYHMSEWRAFRAELRAPRDDVAVLLTTFGLTVLVDLTVAIAVGMVLASFLFIRRMSSATRVSEVRRIDEDDADAIESEHDSWRHDIPPGVRVYEINGPFFFGAAESFRETLERIGDRPRVLVIRMRDVGTLDSTGLRALREVVRGSRRAGTYVVLSDVHTQPLTALQASPVMTEIGIDNVLPDIELALSRAATLASVSAQQQP